jgi:hypothetical protein
MILTQPGEGLNENYTYFVTICHSPQNEELFFVYQVSFTSYYFMTNLWLILAGTVYANTVCNQPLQSFRISDVSAVMGNTTCAHTTANDPSIASDFCFPNGTLDNNTVVVNLSRPFLVQRIQFVPVMFSAKGENYLPESVRVASFNPENKESWFRTSLDAFNNAAWSTVLVNGDMVDLSSDGLESISLRIFPKTKQENPLKFSLKLFGCPLDRTGNVEYVFRSTSARAIDMTFGSMSVFQDKILSILHEETGVDLARIRIRSDQSSSDLVDLSLVVLPNTCPKAKSVQAVVAMLSENERLKKRLDELKNSILDVGKHMCVGKQCPAGTLCIGGQCVSKSGELVGLAPDLPVIDNTVNMRRVLATAPLIEGSGKSKLIEMRQLVAIVLVGGVMLGIVAIGLFRVYKRMSANHGTIE